jgi:hypothetical protein
MAIDNLSLLTGKSNLLQFISLSGKFLISTYDDEHFHCSAIYIVYMSAYIAYIHIRVTRLFKKIEETYRLAPICFRERLAVTVERPDPPITVDRFPQEFEYADDVDFIHEDEENQKDNFANGN